MKKLFLATALLLTSFSSFAMNQKREKLQKLCKLFIKENRWCEQTENDDILVELAKRGVLERADIKVSTTCVWPPSE